MRFLLFAGDDYYPEGGWEDFRDAFAESEAAVAAGKALVSTQIEFLATYRWWHVVDRETLRIVAFSRSGT
jgi:hypothetical protein